MPGTLVPGPEEMRAYLARGLSQSRIADEWERDSGIWVARSAIGMAIKRYGLKSAEGCPRYDDLIPWHVLPQHRTNRELKYLRLEGRSRRGLPLSEGEARRLQDWLYELTSMPAGVVAYDATTSQGFFWLRRREDDVDIVRRPVDAGDYYCDSKWCDARRTRGKGSTIAEPRCPVCGSPLEEI